ncbi:glycosyltransferase [Streptomyces cavernicola]|uniref:D-inositol 3-phosphate glycosyltransferase n=1 Tax=Streptomyces cavernicola TaxID=3043613 RepID=A0ABT6SNS7_9ACTN|nr:glycosyltransferase [Streptomyces sp. B-S-A6]MDI3408896.1 glycosyltransferase [Streptomyces sp. B-S-A6]
MKITYLLARADESGCAERAACTQAGRLADRCEVEVLSVFRTRPEPSLPEARALPVRHLIDRTTSPGRPLRPCTLDDAALDALARLPTELADPAGESGFDRLADLELSAALAALDTDVLVTTSPTLLAAAVTHAPARVATVHQHRRTASPVDPLLLHGPRLDALVAPTERTRLWLAESLGGSAPELAVIPYAVPDGFRPCADGEGRVVVLAARRTAGQRVDHAIRAFAEIADAHPDWTLRIFTDDGRAYGSQSYGSQAYEHESEHELRRLVDASGLHDRVQLLGPCRDMAAEWAKAGIGLLTSGHDETDPPALIEALAAGAPVVAYDVPGGPAEIVRHRVDGLLVPPGDVPALAAALSSLMGDPETLRDHGLAARRGAYERFSSVRVTGLWEELCTRLAARRDRPERLAERADRVAAAIGTGGCAFRSAAPRPAGPLPSADESARENELLERGAAKHLVRSAGRLAEERDDLTLPAAVDRNLRLTTAALESYAVRYLLVRTGGTAHTLAVDADERGHALKALAEATAGEAVYAELLGPHTAAPGPMLAERLDRVSDVGAVGGVKVFRPVTTSTRSLQYGADAACTVAFWSRARDGGPWRAPFGSTLAGAELPDLRPSAELTAAGRRYPTLQVFTERLAGDVDFPVDAVYTQANKARGRDQLRYFLRSLTQYAPWIRHVHLVTADGRPPSWLAPDHPGLTVVADTDAAPAVEGLSEHFLHFSDGMFLGRPTHPDTFFLSSGLPRVFWSTTSEPPLPEHSTELLGRTLTHGVLQAPYALRRSVLAELAERRPPSLQQHYAYLTGRAVPGTLAYECVNLADRAGHGQLGRLLQCRDRTAFRIAESPTGALPEQERTLALRAFLTAYFPVPSPYESRSK